MADTTVHFDVMIIEAGILANCLNSSDAGHALSAKIKDAADAAWAQQTKDVVLELNPFEAGMVLDGLGKASAQISGDLINRLYTLINDMMNALGITALGTQQASDAGSSTDTTTPDDEAQPADTSENVDPSAETAADSNASSDSSEDGAL